MSDLLAVSGGKDVVEYFGKRGFCAIVGAENVLGRGEKVIASHVGKGCYWSTFLTSLAKAGTMEMRRKLDGSDGLPDM